MNAHELANDAKNIHNAIEALEFVQKAVPMLRQQADRIAELEETINACYTVQKMQAEEVYKGNDRIAELEKLLQESAMHNISVTSQADEHYARVKELEKDLHMVQRHYDQLNLPDGYVVVCVHCGSCRFTERPRIVEPIGWHR